ncbi:hypothetical protein E4T44_07968 [Aureobasidium sp. EXF-8845]|nr:hypothetical protein E4T44_07968 [Aureobasidium sp. EXF-8845]KAI4844913.1 hypothetical protein E4T45_07939 [Aureobasidium sp. EXF-8846]
MSNFTKITNNPSDTCPTALKWSVPSEWGNSTSSNYTQAACAVPACDNFPSTLADCCGRADSDLQYFNTTLGPYAACALADSTNLEAYQTFQNCLADKDVAFFRCNSQKENTRPDCGTASANASRALKICCSNYGSVDGFVVYDNGCHVGCVSNSTNGTFSDCVAKEFKGHPGFICTSNDGREIPNTSAGVRDLPSFAGIFTILLLGSSMLML